MRYCYLLLFAFLESLSARAQYAPQAGISGSTAIAKTSTLFKAWANGCTVKRGLQQIGVGSSDYAMLGDSTSALGAPNGDVVSLGDSGVAVLTFAQPITNGLGPDFAVFENGFPNTANAEEAFLELAFVEVSSDGVTFTRFPTTSNTQDTVQLSSVAAPSYTNARQLNNLAGKYISGWGTPFDLSELAGTPGLDINRITHLRIVDAIGSIGGEGSRDAGGRKVNDPFPTPFPGSGFDLDAVGVINAAPAAIGAISALSGVCLFPNPAGGRIELNLKEPGADVMLHDAIGRLLHKAIAENGHVFFSLTDLEAGTYFIIVRTQTGSVCSIAFSHY